MQEQINSKIEKNQADNKDLTRAILMTVASKVALVGGGILGTLLFPSLSLGGITSYFIAGGLAGGLTGFVGALDYESRKGRSVNKWDYAATSAIGLGILNPYTVDALKN